MKTQDRIDFEGYLRNCTNAQVRGVYEKEKKARRHDYAKLARDEAKIRNIVL